MRVKGRRGVSADPSADFRQSARYGWGVQTLHEDPVVRIAEFSGGLVMLMRTAPTEATFAKCVECVRAVGERQAHVTVVFLLPHFDGPPRGNRDAQRALAQAIGNLQERLVGTAVVITVPGVKGAMLRMIMNSVAMMGVRRPMKVHPTPADAVAWMHALPTQTDEVRNSPTLVADLEALLATTTDS